MNGGKREGSGRKLGSASLRTREIADRAIKEGMSPLEVLLKLMRKALDAGDDIVAMDAAKAAAPYIHPRLNAIDIGNKDDKPLAITLNWMKQDIVNNRGWE